MRTRLLSALAGVPAVVALVLWSGGAWPFPGWPFALVVLALVVLGLREFYDGCRRAGLAPRDGFGYAAGVLFLAVALPPFRQREALLLSGGLTVLVTFSFIGEVLRRDHAPLKALAPTWLGALFAGWLLPFAARLRLAEATPIEGLTGWMAAAGEGAWLLLYTWIVTAAVDSGAYFVGKSIGKHKLAPTLSPGKTWEGSIGGFVSAILAAAALGLWLRLPTPFALATGALIGVLAQLGDLSKSAVKREIGIKDFGTLIPGHGGVLDRFDSLMFTAPAVYWLLHAGPS